jgi:hypothetical protein
LRNVDLSIRRVAMQLIASSEWFPEAVPTVPQVQALGGTNLVVIVVLAAPAGTACPETRHFAERTRRLAK